MKKFFMLLLCLGFLMNLNAQAVGENIAKGIKETTGFDVSFINMAQIQSVPGMYIAILQDSNKQAFPIFTTNDGKSFWAVTQFFQFSNNDDNELIKTKFREIEDMNNIGKKDSIDKIFDSLPKEAFLNITSKTKTNKLLTIVTDPDCPYCRSELKNLRNHLKNANVRIVFGVVHDKKAFVKAQLILNETKKLKPTDTDKIISIMEKYYTDIKLTNDQMKTDISIIEKSTETIFGSGLIKGVPYIHEGILK